MTRRGSQAGFPTTDWNLVAVSCRGSDDASREALEKLCATYWYPVYGFVRRCGHEPMAAQDLTQEFFLKLVEKNWTQSADSDRGRFRSFVLGSLKHFLANEWHRQRAQRRGGGRIQRFADLRTAEIRARGEPRDESTPEVQFERRWARAILERTLISLRQSRQWRADPERLERLSRFLTHDDETAPYAVVASELGMSEQAVKAAVHRLRKAFGRLLRQEVTRTVQDPATVDEEIRHLLSVLGRP